MASAGGMGGDVLAQSLFDVLSLQQGASFDQLRHEWLDLRGGGTGRAGINNDELFQMRQGRDVFAQL